MQRKVDNLYDFITIVKENKYLAIVTVRDLAGKNHRNRNRECETFKSAFGITGQHIDREAFGKMHGIRNALCALYFDIDNFKSYNDVYGFEKGDMVIRSLSYILKENIPADQFIGHIGGDDFIAVIVNGE